MNLWQEVMAELDRGAAWWKKPRPKRPAPRTGKEAVERDREERRREQGSTSVRTVSGGSFESNRRRH
jgi:hypothetical protein